MFGEKGVKELQEALLRAMVQNPRTHAAREADAIPARARHSPTAAAVRVFVDWTTDQFIFRREAGCGSRIGDAAAIDFQR